MGSMGSDDFRVRFGRNLVENGELKKVREEAGFSATVQAHMIGVPPTQLYQWEKGLSRPSPTSAAKIAKWYLEAELDLELWSDLEQPQDLVHVSQASQYLGMSYTTVMDWCSRGLIRCKDFGALGLYIPRHEVTSLSRVESN